MKVLKYIFFLLLIVFIAGAIYFAVQDGSYEVAESTVIEAPIEVVFNKVNEYKTWENWGPWKKEDPTMVFNYPEKTSGEGASYSWNGEEVDGSMRTVSIEPYEHIEQEIIFQTPGGERKASVSWDFEEISDGTKVTWSMEGEHTLMDKVYFKLGGYDFDEEMHNMYMTGLNGLDRFIQEDIKAYEINVKGLTQHSGGFYMYSSASVTSGALSAKIEELLGQVSNFMQNNNITISGMPMTIYTSWEPGSNSGIISCGLPTPSRIVVPGESSVLCGYMPSQTVINTTLNGDYSNLQEAWDQTMAYIEENGYERLDSSPPFELYTNDPGEVPNPADWTTEIYVPIKPIDN